MTFDLEKMTFDLRFINKTRHLFFGSLCLVVLFLVSCNNKEAEKTELPVVKQDSSILKLSSPELKTANDALLKDPNNASLYANRARVYISLKEFDQALNDALRAYNLDSSKAENYIILADVYFASNKTRYSKDMLEHTVKKFPENTEALLKMAELYYLVRQYENAIIYINKALKVDDGIAKAYYLKGSVYKELGDTSKAISSMETAIEQDNQYIQAFNDLGLLYSTRKNPIAFQYFDNILKIEPANQDARYNKAKLLQDLNKTDESIIVYEGLLAINKDHSEALYNLGAIYLSRKKDPSKAVDYFSKAIAADPNYTEAYFARGVCFEELKDKANAKADYSMALKLTPNYEPAVEALNALEKK